MKTNQVVIGVITIEPDDIGPDGEYVLACPVNMRVLSVGLVGDAAIVFWVVCPSDEIHASAGLETRRFWVVPGGKNIRLNPDLSLYLGTALIPPRGEFPAQDWHVFSDVSGAVVELPAQGAAKITWH